MPHKSYSEKLKDPRWQKVRLKVLERAGWRCESCESADKTLHVHHGYYDRKREPWDYPIDTLWALCEDCHREAESERLRIHKQLARVRPLAVDVGGILRTSEREQMGDALENLCLLFTQSLEWRRL